MCIIVGVIHYDIICTKFQAIEEDGLQENCRRVGGLLLQEMMSLRDEFEIVGDVRGKGLMLGMELVKNKVSQVSSWSLSSLVARDLWSKTIGVRGQ